MTAEKRVAHINTYFDGPVWAYFCLTYSAYLVLPRVSLCSMPLGWQRRFVALMKQAEQMLPPELQGGEYAIQMRGPRGRFVKDPLCDYRHPPKVELREYMRGHVLRQAARDAGVTDDVSCETCRDTGEIDQTLGGISTSDPHTPCPDCRPARGTLTRG